MTDVIAIGIMLMWGASLVGLIVGIRELSE
jgi:hypothetical protein